MCHGDIREGDAQHDEKRECHGTGVPPPGVEKRRLDTEHAQPTRRGPDERNEDDAAQRNEQETDAFETRSFARIGLCERGGIERGDAGDDARPEIEEDGVEVAADRDGRQSLGAEGVRDHERVGHAHPHVDERDQHDRDGEPDERPCLREDRASCAEGTERGAARFGIGKMCHGDIRVKGGVRRPEWFGAAVSGFLARSGVFQPQSRSCRAWVRR